MKRYCRCIVLLAWPLLALLATMAQAGSVVNLVIDKGATFQHEFIWQDSATGLPINLTGWTARLQVRETLTSDTALVDLSTATSGLTITAADGKILVEIPATDTAALTITTGVYDLEVEETATGFVERLAWGRVTARGEVTR